MHASVHVGPCAGGGGGGEARGLDINSRDIANYCLPLVIFVVV